MKRISRKTTRIARLAQACRVATFLCCGCLLPQTGMAALYCQTQFGVCEIKGNPQVGSTCSCASAAQRRDVGRVVTERNINKSNLSGSCRTPYGVCQVPATTVGAFCKCGDDRGQVIAPR